MRGLARPRTIGAMKILIRIGCLFILLLPTMIVGAVIFLILLFSGVVH